MSRVSSKRAYRERKERAYGAIVAAVGTVGVSPVLIEPRRCSNESCNEYVAPIETECSACVRRSELPEECQGDLWTALSPFDRLRLLAAFKGWRAKCAGDPEDLAVRALAHRCEAGEFATLEALEAAWRSASAVSDAA